MNKQHKKSSLRSYISYYNSIPLLCTLALLGLGFVFTNPNCTIISNTSAHALETEAAAQDASMMASGVSLSLDTSLPTDATLIKQVSDDGTNYIEVNFTVKANNVKNYNVYVQASNSTLTGATSGDRIQSITTNTIGTVAEQRWGIGLERGDVAPENMTYQPVQTNVNTAMDTNENADGTNLTAVTQPYTLAFAANLAGAQADHYRANIILSVAANAKDVTQFLGFEEISYLQDMTEPICYHAQVGETKRLGDVRDKAKTQKNAYWVTKLADGHCWMVEDLRYQQGTSTELVDWPNGDDAESYATQRYYQPGLYVMDDPTSTEICGGTTTFATKQDWLDKCLGHGVTDVSTMTASNDPNFYYNHGNKVVDGNEYDAHFLIGNYYNFTAATAGSIAVDETDTYAPDSICPTLEGWRIPIADNWSPAGSTSKLYNAYSALSALEMRLAPLYLITPGLIHGPSGGNVEFNLSGMRWTGLTEKRADQARAWGIEYNNVFYAYRNKQRSAGLAMRCVFLPLVETH